MTWTLVLVLAAGAYLFKVIGLVVIGARPLPAVVERCLALIPAALIAALVVNDTFAYGSDLVLDARVAGVGVAAIAAWRRAPLIVVIVIGAAVTALVRQAGLSRSRLPLQIRRSTARPPSSPPSGPPSHHGKRRSSSHVNRVRRPPSIGVERERARAGDDADVAHAHRPHRAPTR